MKHIALLAGNPGEVQMVREQNGELLAIYSGRDEFARTYGLKQVDASDTHILECVERNEQSQRYCRYVKRQLCG